MSLHHGSSRPFQKAIALPLGSFVSAPTTCASPSSSDEPGSRMRVAAEVRPRVDVAGPPPRGPSRGRLDVARCPGPAGSGPVHVHTGCRGLGEAVRAPGRRRAQRRSGREHEREGRLPVEQDRPRAVERRLRGPCGARRETPRKALVASTSHECYPDPSSHRRHFLSPQSLSWERIRASAQVARDLYRMLTAELHRRRNTA